MGSHSCFDTFSNGDISAVSVLMNISNDSNSVTCNW